MDGIGGLRCVPAGPTDVRRVEYGRSEAASKKRCLLRRACSENPRPAKPDRYVRLPIGDAFMAAERSQCMAIA